MLQVNNIEEHIDAVKDSLRKRNWTEDAIGIVDDTIDLNNRRKALQTEVDHGKSQLNQLAKEIGNLFKTGNKAEAETLKEKVGEIKQQVEQRETEMNETTETLRENLFTLPNVLHESVPAGASEEDNEIYRPFEGELPDMGEDALPHWELAEKYNLIDFQLGAKISGSGFPLFRGKGSKLQRGLISYFLDQASNAGFEEIVPPLLVNEDSAMGTGQLPDKEGQMYHVTADNLYLIPTAEVPITNILRDTILDENDFPIKLTGYTPCFRREAGSYGAHVKGLNRVHQFDKVEIVQIEHPERSYETLNSMVDHVAMLLDSLNLPYRILKLCGGDTGFASALTYDFEVYSAAQKRWLEVSSVSNFETFQANRLKLRYKDSEGKKHLAHTLNGSALALARIIACLLENNQTPDGIKMPEVLVDYLGFDMI